MRLLILGASGGCGRWATKLAADRGHDVAALVRPSAVFDPPPGVRTIRGEVLDAGTVEAALAGVDAVLCCVGIRRRWPANPWSAVVSPRDLTARVAQILVSAMPRQRVGRLVAISAAGVGDSAARVSPINRWLFAHSNVGVAYADLEVMEQALRQSDLDWMAVRPATLTNGGPTGRARVAPFYGATTRISRGDVAAWMLDALERHPAPFADRTPMIASRGG